MMPTTSMAIIDATNVNQPRATMPEPRRARTVVPAALGALREREREEDERGARADEEEADEVELLRKGPRGADDARVDGALDLGRGGGRGDEPELLGLALRPGERDDKGGERSGDEYREHAIYVTLS